MDNLINWKWMFTALATILVYVYVVAPMLAGNGTTGNGTNGNGSTARKR